MDEARSARPISAPVRATVGLLFPASTWMTIALAGVVLINGILPAAFALAGGALVGVMGEAAGQGFGAIAVDRMLGAGGAVVGIFVAQQVATPLLRTLAQALGRRADLGLRGRVMRATLQPQGIAHLEDPSMAECAWEARAVGTGEVTARHAIVGLAALASRALTALSLALVLGSYRWWAAAVLVAVYGALCRSLVGDLRRRVGPPPPVRSGPRAVLGRLWLPLGATTGMALTQGGIFALLARSVVVGEITLAQLATFALAAYGLSAIARVYPGDLKISSGSAPVPTVAQLEKAISSYRFRLAGSRPADGLPRSSIAMEGVSFGYPWRHEQVLHDVDLHIPAGRSLAVVGERRAGKTTLVKLLARLYDPTGGRILVDGIDLSDLSPASWHDRLAVTFQDFSRYPLSMLENVTFGAVGSGRDEDARQLAADQAGLEEVLDRLPDGWNSLLSPGGGPGVDLSEGEWQKVALARALFALHARGGVLVLDEPTAALDVGSAVAFYDRFLELTSGATTILVSHHLAAVRRTDQVVLMDHGRVIEHGHHDTLLEAGGPYAQLFERQSARFDFGEADQWSRPALSRQPEVGGAGADA